MSALLLYCLRVLVSARALLMVGGGRTACASTASSLNLRRANTRRPLTHSALLKAIHIHLHVLASNPPPKACLNQVKKGARMEAHFQV
jgi:hypothetical protein